MKRLIAIGPLALALALAGVALAQEPARAPAALDRYSGQISLRLKDGRQTTLQVTIRDWIVPNLADVERFPQDGSLFCQLRGGGSLATTLQGESRQRAEGDAWWVPAGTVMGVRTGNDAVVLHTVAVAPVAGAR